MENEVAYNLRKELDWADDGNWNVPKSLVKAAEDAIAELEMLTAQLGELS